MCGIAGFCTLQAPSGGESIVRRMRDSLHHRGPDSAGIHIDAPAYLGFRRLAIIDLAGGLQPMSNED
jgi:asparagine synthase (glutamine-hydrolysing)